MEDCLPGMLVSIVFIRVTSESNWVVYLDKKQIEACEKNAGLNSKYQRMCSAEPRHTHTHYESLSGILPSRCIIRLLVGL